MQTTEDSLLKSSSFGFNKLKSTARKARTLVVFKSQERFKIYINLGLPLSFRCWVSKHSHCHEDSYRFCSKRGHRRVNLVENISVVQMVQSINVIETNYEKIDHKCRNKLQTIYFNRIKNPWLSRNDPDHGEVRQNGTSCRNRWSVS